MALLTSKMFLIYVIFWSLHPFTDAFVLHTLAAFLFGRLL